jgi:hypothetical protein
MPLCEGCKEVMAVDVLCLQCKANPSIEAMRLGTLAADACIDLNRSVEKFLDAYKRAPASFYDDGGAGGALIGAAFDLLDAWVEHTSHGP